MSTMRDGRSHVADSTRLSLFDIILRANVEARRQTQVRSGEAEFLYQGDIAMNKRDVVDIVNGGGAGRRKRAVMKKLATRLWQPKKIAYVISSDLGKFAKLAILAAIKHWEDTLPCMGKWRDINNLDSSKRPRNYIRFIKGEGCYSRVGRQRGRQLISIGTGCGYVGVVTHEIGHAMGFWHEQSRTDRDEYINIHWNNILPAMRFNFEKYTSSRIDDLGVEYDYESVMHYGPKAFSKDGRSSTISIKRNKNKNGVRLGQRYRLSELDKKQARLLYNCNVKSPPCSSNPCLNAGVCSNNGDRYTCRCTSGYTGVRCENREGKPLSTLLRMYMV
ncbi:protein SpAN-like [Dendronephthya gigantea]|uniref:protein SpAN-like n=1 Tax=Dendronephthya gigantea TaxID=151771 RepID=UPI00106B535A|nr:protein SpAN-like [Dendronephthya gigantea]